VTASPTRLLFSAFLASRLILLRSDGFSIMRYQLASPQPTYWRPISFGPSSQISVGMPYGNEEILHKSLNILVTQLLNQRINLYIYITKHTKAKINSQPNPLKGQC